MVAPPVGSRAAARKTTHFYAPALAEGHTVLPLSIPPSVRLSEQHFMFSYFHFSSYCFYWLSLFYISYVHVLYIMVSKISLQSAEGARLLIRGSGVNDSSPSEVWVLAVQNAFGFKKYKVLCNYLLFINVRQ